MAALSVLALDPGEKCGWARAEVAPDGKWSGLKHGITHLKPMALKVHEVAGDYDVVIYETWRLFPHKARQMIGSDMQTSQLIGMVRLACWLHPQVKVVSQGPDLKKSADKSMPAALKRRIARMPKAHDESHDGDALRHLWIWTFKNYIGESNAT